MEHISQFVNQEEDEAFHVNYSSSAIAPGVSLVGGSTLPNHIEGSISNSSLKKKAMNNNFVQPSQ
jgi:hypothetical protein